MPNPDPPTLHRRTGTLLVLALTLFLPAAGHAAEAPAETGRGSATLPFIERVEVNVVNVEAFVTDRDGRPVGGLGRDDFVVRVDGEPVELSNFAATTAQARDELPTRLPLRTTGPQPVSETAPARPSLPTEPGLPPLHMVVFVDNLHIHPARRKRVLDDLDVFLDASLRPGDRVMLMSFDGGLHVVQSLTDDREELATAAQRLRRTAARQGEVDAQWRAAVRLMTLPKTERELADSTDYLVGSFVQHATDRLRDSVAALETTVRSLAGLPGRKALVYVSEGLPQRPGEELIYMQHGDTAAASLEANREDQSPLFAELVRQTNAQQVTLYTVDARGPEAGSLLSAEHGDVTNAVLEAAAPNRHTLERLRQSNYQEPLVHLAASTGGTALLNTFAFDAGFRDMARDFQTFYSLGFVSPFDGDGAYHRLEVEVTRPGVRVRHRNGYLDKPVLERVADRTLSFLMLDQQSNPLGADLQFGDPERDDGHWLVRLLIRVPTRGITLLPQGDEALGRLHFYLAVRDGEGRRSQLIHLPYAVSAPGAELAANQSRDVGYTTRLKLRAGRSDVIVGIYDEVGGGEAYLYRRLHVSDAPEPPADTAAR